MTKKIKVLPQPHVYAHGSQSHWPEMRRPYALDAPLRAVASHAHQGAPKCRRGLDEVGPNSDNEADYKDESECRYTNDVLALSSSELDAHVNGRAGMAYRELGPS